MYNARAFFIADVLVHVGAPVGETAFRSKRYTLCLPLRPSVSLSHMRPFFVFCPLFSLSSLLHLLFFSSRHLLVVSISLFLFFLSTLSDLRLRSPGIGRLVLTRLIQMNRGLSDVSRGLTGFSKLKRGGRRRPRVSRTLRNRRSRFTCPLAPLLLFFGVLAPIHP